MDELELEERRRHDSKLDRLEQLCTQNAVQVAALVKTVEKMEDWREHHVVEASVLQTTVALQRQSLDGINVTLKELKESLTSVATNFLAAQNKFKGGWFMLMTAGGFLMGGISLVSVVLNVFGVI